MKTECPAFASFRASVDPIFPAPMIPILMCVRLSVLCRQFAQRTPNVIREPRADSGASVRRIGGVANCSLASLPRATLLRLLDSNEFRVRGATGSRRGIDRIQIVTRDLVDAFLRRPRAIGIAARHPFDGDSIALDRVRPEPRDHSLRDAAVLGVRSFQSVLRRKLGQIGLGEPGNTGSGAVEHRHADGLVSVEVLLDATFLVVDRNRPPGPNDLFLERLAERDARRR